MKSTVLKFSRKDPKKFFKTLNSRVNSYFKENNLKRTGNWQLWLKNHCYVLHLFSGPISLF